MHPVKSREEIKGESEGESLKREKGWKNEVEEKKEKKEKEMR